MLRTKSGLKGCLLLLLLILNQAFANGQNATVAGKVTDASDGAPLIGATVVVEGSTQGNITNLDGEFFINDVPEGATIQASFLGYVSNSKVYEGNPVNIALEPESKMLGDVVITALGIEREEKSLGYAQSAINADQISEAPATNWSQALNGKVAGLGIAGASTGPNSSSKITLRGDNSLSSEGNDALVILDGIPISSRTVGTGVGSYMGSDNAVDFGNRLSDLNAEDIASITVLKGPGASALYGSRAANGVLIITTKSGARKSKGVGITINSSISFDDVLRWPDYQFEYGEGSNNADYYSYMDSEDGPSQVATATYGPKFDANKLYYQYNPNSPDGIPTERTPWVAYPNTYKDFFEVGITYNNSISIEGGDENSSARLSFTHVKNEWIIPTTGWQSYTASLGVNHSISEKLKVVGRVNYTLKDNENIPMSGYNNHSIAYNMLFRQPNYDNAWYPQTDYWKEGQENVDHKRIGDTLTGDNPYFLAKEIRNSSVRNSVTASATAAYDFSNQLSLTVRSGIDLGNETRVQRRPFNITRYPEGMYKEQLINMYEFNTDVFFNYKTLLSQTIGLVATAGTNIMRSKHQGLMAYADKLSLPGIYNLANSKDMPQSVPEFMEKQINSVYSTINFSYDNKVFLDLTGRNDWSSTLPQGNNSYFYPSVNMSFVASDMVDLPAVIHFTKVRMSWAQVGNDARPYRTMKYYNPSEFPGSLENPRILYNQDLKPEITTSMEGGLDLRLFKGRVSLDLAFYESKSRNQILDIALANESGYSSATLNSGLVRNRGAELMLSVQPVVSRDFSWTSTILWSKNNNKVLELAEGMDYQPIAESPGAAYIRATVGGTTGDIFGYRVQRSPDGQMIFRDGVPLLTETNNEYIGNAHPDWKGSFTNQFSYKGWSLNVQFDGQMGGMLFSQTHHKLAQRGRLVSTLPGRDVGYVVGKGVVQNQDGSFSPNTVQVNPQRYYDQYYRRNNAETNTFDASFLKLREASLSYRLPTTLVHRVGLQNATIGVFGRDLLLFTKDFPAFDPETAQMEASSINIGYENGQLPSTRTLGVSLRVGL